MDNERLTAVNSPPPPDYKRLSAELLAKLLADATERIKALEAEVAEAETNAVATDPLILRCRHETATAIARDLDALGMLGGISRPGAARICRAHGAVLEDPDELK